MSEEEKRERKRLSKRKYYLQNKDKWKKQSTEYSKQYYVDNKEDIKENVKNNRHRYPRNKEKVSLYMKEYRKTYSKEKKREQDRESYKRNSEKRKISARIYKTNRKKNDLLYRFSFLIRTRIYQSISNRGYTKRSKTFEILGCEYRAFKVYIESKFEHWMTWENYGLYNGELNYGWDLDHITPISSAKSEEDIIKLNHYTNFQPLCSLTNRYIKKDNLV